jgi:predicted exporter
MLLAAAATLVGLGLLVFLKVPDAAGFGSLRARGGHAVYGGSCHQMLV